MARHSVGKFESWVGDAAPVKGRTVLGLGVALGLIVGLGTWLLSDAPAPRDPLSLAQPAAAIPPPDVMAPTLGAPAPEGTDGMGQAPPVTSSPANGAGGAGPSRTPVAAKSSTAAPPPVVLSLTARYATRTAWADGYVADIFVTNPSSVTQSFTVQLDLPRSATLTNQVWNATAEGSYGKITFRGGPVAAGQTLQFGFVGNKSSYVRDARQLTPTACSVNSSLCDGFSNPASSYDSSAYGGGWSTVRADGMPQNRMWRFG